MKINGETKSIAPDTTLLALLEALGHKPARVAAELNGEIIPRENFATTRLEDSDVLEIVCFVGGG